jgi:hypothetical protein
MTYEHRGRRILKELPATLHRCFPNEGQGMCAGSTQRRAVGQLHQRAALIWAADDAHFEGPVAQERATKRHRPILDEAQWPRAVSWRPVAQERTTKRHRRWPRRLAE